MRDEEEILATQRLLEVIREGGSRPAGAQVETPGADSGLARPSRGDSLHEGLVLTRPLRARSLVPGRVRIGLDVGNHSVKMVRLERGARRYRLLQLGLAPVVAREDTPEARAEAQVISAKALLQGIQTKRESVITALSDPGIIIRQLTLPWMSERDLEQAIPFEARKHIPYDISQVMIRYQILGDGRRGSSTRVMLMAVPLDAYHRHREMIVNLGLEPYAIEVGPLALANAYLLCQGKAEEAIVLLDIGAKGTIIDIHKQGGMFFYRHLPISGERFTKEIRARFDLTFEAAEAMKRGQYVPEGRDPEEIGRALLPVMDALVMEIRRSLAYYDNVTGKMGFSRVLLTGGGSMLPGLSKYLEETLELPVQVMDPLGGVSWDDVHFARGWIEKTRPLWAIAIGLATRR